MAIKFLNTVAVDTDILYVDTSNDRVGIGTDSPQAKLDVDGDTFLASRHIKISGTGINTYFTAATHDSSGTEGLLNKLSIKSVGTFFDHGALAITNTAVAEPLDTTIVQETISSGDTDWNVLTLPKESGTFALENWVTSNFAPSTGGSYLPLTGGTLSGNLTITKSSATMKVSEAGGGDIRMVAGGATGYIGTYNNTSMQIMQNGGNAIFIDTSKNVGIGTTSPQEKLHVSGGVGIFNVSDDWHQSSLGTHLFRGSEFATSIGNETSALKIFPASNSRDVGKYWGGINFMHLDPENSSWGTSFTGSQFWIGGRVVDLSGQERSALVFATNDSTTAGTHPTEKMAILPNGNIGVGTTSPSSLLHIHQTGSGTNNSIITEDDARKIFIGRDSIKATNLSDNPAELYIQQDGGNATFGNDISLGGNLTLTTNARYLRAEDNAGTTTRLLGINGSNTTYIGPIDAYAGGGIFYGASANVSSHTLYTGASARLHIDSSGNVGIGTTSPLSRLHVISREINNGANKGIRIENYNGTKDYSIRTGVSGSENTSLAFYDETAGANRMVIASGGNVGIGTTSPTTPLQVAGIAQIVTGSDIAFYGGNYVRVFGDQNYGFRNTGGTYIANISMSGNSYFNGGNVGIGTTSPTQKLQVNGRLYIEHQGSDWNETTPGQGIGSIHLDPAGSGVAHTGNAITFGSSDHSNGSVADAGIYTRSDGSYGTKMYLATTDSYAAGSRTRMMINSNGNVGIGTTNPTQLLHVYSQTSNPTGIGVQNSQRYYSVRSNNYSLVFTDETVGSERMRIDNNGKVGIGTTAPSQLLHVAGNMRLQNQLYDSTNSLGSNGEVLTKVSAGTEWKVPAVNAQMPNNTAPASAANVGTIRYRSTSNTSFVDMSMQTGATTYTWVNIVSNFW